MTDVMQHRGPDDEGFYLAPGIALGMRRLSIIDLPGGHQPVANENGSILTIFNGEIYNFRELRKRLERSGHEFSTAGDTETIVHLYEEHDVDFVHHLRGMFAIALWDAPRARLVLARDRMGVKPLYVMRMPRGLAFASEVKCLIAGGLLEPALDPLGAELFMAFGFVPGPHALFARVQKLQPASILVWQGDRGLHDERTYWTPWDESEPDVGRDWQSDEERLLSLLRTSVDARMISDVPLGVMLSGGIDSSLITALMSERAGGPVKTFAIGFAEDAQSNELDDARAVARRLGTEHHELLTSARDHPDLLDQVLWHQEEPVADLSGLGFLLLSRMTRERVTVALSGQGADELLGGYRKHQVAAAAAYAQRAPATARHLVARLGAAAPAGSTLERGLRAVSTGDAVDRMLAMSRIVQSNERGHLFGDTLLRNDGEEAIASAIAQHLPSNGDSPLGQTCYLDARLGLVDNLLLYFDKLSMAASLEVRVPFLDHDVVAFCHALPDDRRIRMGRRKNLLKRASAGLVDDAIINKKKRGFFHAALGSWETVHRDGLIRDVLLDGRTRGRGLFRPEAVTALVAGAGQGGTKADQRVFCMLLLELWNRFYVDADGPGRRKLPQSAS